MKDDTGTRLLAPDKRSLWRAAEPFVWSFIDSDLQEDPARSIMRTLWDQPRWLETYHLYDERGSGLFEEISMLPEYYLARTENSILEREARRIIAAAPVKCIVELGAGSAKKTTHLLRAQLEQRGSGIFAPIDVSLPGLLVSRDSVQRDFPAIDFHGLHARYQAGLSSIKRDLPKLFVFLGSTIGNFHPPAFTRFFARLSTAMGPDDFLLLGADRIKDFGILESAYDDARGVTAEFILNAFANINHLLGSNFDRSKMRYRSWYNPEWRQIEMYAVSTEMQTIRFPAFAASFCWEQGERILVEISRKFDPLRLQEQLSFFDLLPLNHFTDPEHRFSLLLFRKSAVA
jgi:L-histidine N-alpha-methyltransferase